MNNAIYILTVGYPPIDSKSNEEIVQCALSKDGLGNLMVKDPIEFYDYHIIMVKDVKLLISSSQSFGEVGKYKGILAFNFWPLNIYLRYHLNTADRRLSLKKKFNDLFSNFISSYSKALEHYLISKNIKGTNILFKKEHWLGKVFDKYKEHFKYDGCFSPSSNLELIIRFQNAIASLAEESSNELCKKSYEAFATTPGGLTVGAIVRVGDSSLILHPKPLFNGDVSLKNFAREFLDSIEANLLGVRYPEVPKPQWVNDLFIEEQKRAEDNFRKAYEEYRKELEEIEIFRSLYWQKGEELVKATEFVLKKLGFDVENISGKGESRDLIVRFKDFHFIVEVKGKERATDKLDVSNFIANNHNENLIFIVNHYRLEDPRERKNKPKIYFPYTPAAIETIRNAVNNKMIKSFYLLTTIDLVEWWSKKLVPNNVIEELNRRVIRV